MVNAVDNVMAPLAITRSADHHYTYQGVTYPGVTTVLEAAGATFSVASRYGANQCAETVAELMDRGALQAMWEAQGPEAFRKGLAASAVKRCDEAANLGTEVHGLADLVVRGEPTPSMTEGVRKRVLAYAEWWKASGWTLRLSEAMIINPISDTVGYGGTFDLLAKDRDERTVLADIKTGNLYPKAVLQLAAYGLAPWVQFSDGKVYTLPKPDRYVILHVTLDGVREVELSIGTAEHMAFLACLDLHYWAESMKGKRL